MNYSFEFEHQRAARKKIIIRVAIIIVEVIVVILAAFLLTHKGMVVFTVSGQDMAPTLNNGDRLLINKMSYRIHSIKRNDIVVVKQSGAEHNYFSVERVIGLPGEKVQIINGEVYIDDEKYEEKYDFPKMENGGLALESIVLDDDEYFLLCDNRNSGEDSRNANVGNVSKAEIIGKAWIRLNTVELIRFISTVNDQKKDSSTSE